MLFLCTSDEAGETFLQPHPWIIGILQLNGLHTNFVRGRTNVYKSRTKYFHKKNCENLNRRGQGNARVFV